MKKFLCHLGAARFFAVLSGGWAPGLMVGAHAQPANDLPAVALIVTEWARAATGGATQAPNSNPTTWTLLITIKNLSAHDLHNLQVQCAMYKRMRNGSIEEMAISGNNHAAAFGPNGRWFRQQPIGRGAFQQQAPQGQPHRFVETVFLRVGEIKQLKVEASLGGRFPAGGDRLQNFTSNRLRGNANLPLTAQPTDAATEKYVGFSCVIIHNGQIIAREDRNPERLPNFGISGAR
jgi:hypothetical protein